MKLPKYLLQSYLTRTAQYVDTLYESDMLNIQNDEKTKGVSVK